MSRLAYKFRIYPTKAQTRSLELTLDTCRNVYNSFVHERTVLYEITGKSPTYLVQKRAIAAWKPNHPELLDVHSQVLQNVCKRADLAFRSFFRRLKLGEEPGYPRLKGKDGYDSITYPQYGNGCEIRHGNLWLSKIGEVKINLHRSIQGDIKTCSVRRIGEKWFVCFSVVALQQILDPCSDEIGIDVGLKVFARLDNDDWIDNPRFFRKDEAALAKAQRRFETVKNKHRSKARRCAKKVVARIHERIRNRRHNFVHQEARKLVNRYGVIYVENLAVGNMIATPKPKSDPDKPGEFLPNGAAAKAGLNKSIADASWSMFRSVLAMKAENAGRLVVAVNPAYTSQTCSGCGNIVKKTLIERTHRCSVCGLVLDRDTNAAINIKALGQQSIAATTA